MLRAALLCVFLVAGCGGNNSAIQNATGNQTPPAPPATPPAPPPPPPPAAGTAVSDNGSIHHANSPIVGARIYLFAANTTGYGDASVSLLNPALTGASDAIGAYVTSAADGSFSMKGDYTCVLDTQVYLYAVGGNAGSGDNNAIGLLALLGSCPSSGNFSSTTSAIWVNEISTVAAAFAVAGFAIDATHVSSSGTPLAQTGIANAFVNAANLSNITSGAALSSTPAGNGVVPQSLIDTLGNILAACVGSTGTTSGSANSACSALFANATADGTVSGALPTDTATAAIYIAQHPGVNIAPLFALADSTSFSPALAAQPNDLTIMIGFTGGGLTPGSIGGVAIDGLGNAWLTNSGSNGIIKLASSGAPLSPSTGFTGGGLTASKAAPAIAIDDGGNAWITDIVGCSVAKLSNAGAPLSPSTGFTGGGLSFNAMSFVPSSIAIDASGNAWVAGAGIVAEFSNSGTPLSPSTGFPSATPFGPTYIAVDATGNLWYETETLTANEISSAGAPLGNYSCVRNDETDGITIDGLGNKWLLSSMGLTKLTAGPAPTCLDVPGIGTTLEVAPPMDGAVAVDGSGNVWACTGTIHEISNSLPAISPSAGYQPVGAACTAIAVDGAGNVWLSSYSGASELVGVATPVVTPLATGVKNNTLGSRP